MKQKETKPKRVVTLKKITISNLNNGVHSFKIKGYTEDEVIEVLKFHLERVTDFKNYKVVI
jgi:hypothetical protein